VSFKSLLAPRICSPFVRIAVEFPNLLSFLHHKLIILPKKKVERRSLLEVHLELGEEELGPGSWSSS